MPRYLTAHIPGTGGIFKESDEDFLVTEIPAYLPCGEGEHLYVEIEKRGITTLEAIRRIGRALNLPEREIGYAGMKDSRGITRQTISLPRIRPEAALELDIPGIRILSALRHRNKLKLGHLRGNRFRVRVRGVSDGAGERAAEVLKVLEQRGVPNYFGSASGMARRGIRTSSAGPWSGGTSGGRWMPSWETRRRSRTSGGGRRWRRTIAGSTKRQSDSFPASAAPNGR